jgi:hypothetical protein
MPDDDHERRRLFRRRRRLIRSGDAYTADELDRGEVELEQVPTVADPPPEETRGEPWGWTKGPPYPRGWREDGEYPGQRSRDDPGPFDGAWEPPAEQEGRGDGA